jgi:hypothetical protein
VYTVEISTDPGFGTKVFTREDIPEDGSGTTSVTLPALPASAGDVTYYWRSFAVVDGTPGPMSPTQKFVVQQQIVIQQPTPIEPASGATVGQPRPTFRIKNSTFQGAAGPITYLFEVSASSSFSPLLASGSIGQQSDGQTAWSPSTDLPNGTVYWRALAKDATNSESSSYTSSVSFTVQPFDPHKAIFVFSPDGIADWPETTRITSVVFDPNALLVDFDRREGSDPWPETGGRNFGSLQYSLGICENIDDQWYCSAPIQFWKGRDLEAAGAPDLIPDLWYYDARRWGPMASHSLADGELIAVWVGSGNLRGGGGETYRERSNFAMVRFHQNYFGQ